MGLLRMQPGDHAENGRGAAAIVPAQGSGCHGAVAFIRVGTLDDPDALPPDVHIFTASKQPWVVLPAGTPAFAEFYDRNATWPAESLERRRTLLARR